ncbi:MAG: GNAT family N-acetyltransferase [Bryobacteraceae bacterium]
MAEIRVLSATDILGMRAALNDLLLDAVRGGASVGFLQPLDAELADKYWLGVEAAVRMGSTVLMGAFEAGRIAGTVQLGLAYMPNATHRAEVMKLLVHTSARRKGIGSALMQSIEAEAARLRRTLLILDTERESVAESLYRQLGWTTLGAIPRYALSSDSTLHDTVFFYKELA